MTGSSFLNPACSLCAKEAVVAPNSLRVKIFNFSRLRSARAYAEQTLKVQTDAERKGSRWRYWRIRLYDQLGRKVEVSKSSICHDSFLLFYLPHPNTLRAIDTATSNVAESATVRGDQISIPLLLRSS